jgi:hypothetical protein
MPGNGVRAGIVLLAGVDGAPDTVQLAFRSHFFAGLSTYHPDYDEGGCGPSGFGWHQGWNDRVDASAVAEYELKFRHPDPVGK